MTFSIQNHIGQQSHAIKFGGVYIHRDMFQDKMTGVTFGVFPDDVFTGVRYQGQFAPSAAADEMTRWGSRGKTPEDRSTASTTLQDYRRLRVHEKLDAIITDAVAGNIMSADHAEKIRALMTRHNADQVRRAALPQNASQPEFYCARQDRVNPFYTVEDNVLYGENTYQVGAFEYRDPRNFRAIPSEKPLTVSGPMPTLTDIPGADERPSVLEVSMIPASNPSAQPPVVPPPPPTTEASGEEGGPEDSSQP